MDEKWTENTKKDSGINIELWWWEATYSLLSRGFL
jgi:hypothetical protein